MSELARRKVRHIDGQAIAAIGQVAVLSALRGCYCSRHPYADDHQRDDDCGGESVDERVAIAIGFSGDPWRRHGKPREFVDDMFHLGTL